MNKKSTKRKYRNEFLKPVHTLEETAKKFGLTRVGVLFIERRALKKLRKALNNQGYYSVSDIYHSNDKQNREDCVF